MHGWIAFGGDFTPLASPDYDPAKARFNDGRCDSAGRFWAGTMGSRATGRAASSTGWMLMAASVRSATPSSSPMASPSRPTVAA